MGAKYRKSKKIGNSSRITATSKSVGVSTGGKNVRISVNSKGGTGISFRIPGTNIRFRKYSRGSNSLLVGSLIMLFVYILQFIAWISLICLFIFWWIIKYTVLGTVWLYKKIFEICKSAFIKLKNKKEKSNDL